MSWPLEFPYRIEYAESPTVSATLRRNGMEHRLAFEVDSGADYTLAHGELLLGLGFDPPRHAVVHQAFREGGDAALATLGCRRFRSAGGSADIYGFGIEVYVSLAGGPQEVEMTIYGSLTLMTRNLLGRDFFRKVNLVAFDDKNCHLYLGSP